VTKKFKAQQELEEAVKREVSSDDCPFSGCGVRFYGSTLSRDSHRRLYPGHFTGEAQPVYAEREAAVTENLQGKIKRAKKEATE